MQDNNIVAGSIRQENIVFAEYQVDHHVSSRGRPIYILNSHSDAIRHVVLSKFSIFP